jgi:hypothetical protein
MNQSRKNIIMEQRPNIKVHLSRSIYPLESSVIGTISIPSSKDITLIQLYVAGRCRLDSRWHDVQTIKNKYNSHPCHDDLPSFVETRVEDSYFQKVHHHQQQQEDSSVCFWSTNVLTLYDDNHDNDNDSTHDTSTNDTNHQPSKIMVPLINNGDPKTKESYKPLQMNGSDWFQQGLEITEAMQCHRYDTDDPNQTLVDDDYDSCQSISSHRSSSSSNSSNSSNSTTGIHQELSQRQPIANDNHSFHDLRIQDEEKHHVIDLDATCQETKENLTTVDSSPLFFTFRADIPKDIPPTVSAVSARIFYSVVVHVVTKEGTSFVIQAPFTIIASSNVESHMNVVSKTKISIGVVNAISHTKPYLIPLSSTYTSEPWSLSVKRQHCIPDNIKTISVEDQDKKCCSLTIIGGGVIVPGECILLQFSFPCHEEYPFSQDALPCYQVSSCLRGNEYVIATDGTRKTSRSYSFDTDHLNVIPGVTTSVSLRLRLPHDCPITISTDFFAIHVACRIDLTVKGSDETNFRFLTVEFPCQVNQDGPTFEPMENDLPPDLENKLFAMKWSDGSPASNALKRIVSSEVFNDIRTLSLLAMNN